ncbi:hypothetical protein QZH41_005258 [Actinostola sp. cb2023]|nr:hypothetical protein QZH41_005258 [Actinostola sp. cb2023]
MTNAEEIEFQRLHRFGRPKNGSRPVIARFLRYKDVIKVLQNTFRLKGSSISIFQDFPKEIQDSRKRQLQKLKKAKDEGKSAYFSKSKPDKLYIEDCQLDFPRASTQDYVTISSAFAQAVTQFTLSFWLKIPSSYSDLVLVFGYATTDGNSQMSLGIKRDGITEIDINGGSAYRFLKKPFSGPISFRGFRETASWTRQGPDKDPTRTRQGPDKDPTRTRQGPDKDPTRTRQGPDKDDKDLTRTSSVSYTYCVL